MPWSCRVEEESRIADFARTFHEPAAVATPETFINWVVIVIN